MSMIEFLIYAERWLNATIHINDQFLGTIGLLIGVVIISITEKFEVKR